MKSQPNKCQQEIYFENQFHYATHRAQMAVISISKQEQAPSHFLTSGDVFIGVYMHPLASRKYTIMQAGVTTTNAIV